MSMNWIAKISIKNYFYLNIFWNFKYVNLRYKFCTFQGRTFSSIIQNFLKSFKLLEDEYVPQYATPKGRRNYEETLAACKKYFPQYVRELEGIADGAKVPFEKVS